MSPTETAKSAAAPQDDDFEATDGGWDPYVTSLMMNGERESAAADGEDDGVPVMSFSRSPPRR